MAQAGFTPIKLYYSTTAAATPLAADLALGELALNANDGKLYYKNSVTNLVTQVAGGGATYTLNGVAYANTTTSLSNNGSFTYDGTTVTVSNDMVVSAGTQRLGVGSGGDTTSTVFGFEATNPTGTNAVAIGYQALKNNAGTYNVGVGYRALTSNTTGNGNVSMGYESARYITDGGANTSVGYRSLRAASGSGSGTSNTAVGYDALYSQTDNNSTAVGYHALRLCTGQSNTAVGYQSSNAVTTGVGNTSLGYQAGTISSTGNYNVCLGYKTQVNASGDNYEVVIGVAASGGALTGKGSSTAYISANLGGTYNGANVTTWAVTSDARIKKNVVDLTDALTKINALRAVKFDYKENDKHEIGFIAQEYGQILPDQIITHDANEAEKEWVGEDKVMAIQQNLVPYLVKAIQELKAEFDAYKASHP